MHGYALDITTVNSTFSHLQRGAVGVLTRNEIDSFGASGDQDFRSISHHR